MVGDGLGKSAPTNALKVGVAAEPVVGPDNTVFAVCVSNAGAKVPLDVIGQIRF